MTASWIRVQLLDLYAFWAPSGPLWTRPENWANLSILTGRWERTFPTGDPRCFLSFSCRRRDRRAICRSEILRLIFQRGANSAVPGALTYPRLVGEVFDTSLGVKPKQRVWIQSWDHTLDLAKAFASECSLRDCPCLLSVRYEDVWLRSIVEGSQKQFENVSPLETAALEETDFFIFTMGPRRPVLWGRITKEKRRQASVWLDTRYDKSSYAARWARIAKANKVKMLAIEATLATPERAKAQGLSYEEWRDVMFQGCMANSETMARRARRLAKLVSGKGRVSVTSSTGTRLNFDLDRRPVSISDGISTDEMARKGRIVFLPAGAVEVSGDEESAAGRIVWSEPVRLGGGMPENLAIDLEDGLIEHHTETRGAGVFEKYLRRGGKEAGRFAFFGFGLNPNLKRGFTQDDKVLGAVTLGFGGNESMGGKNPADEQWWASLEGATVKLDGRTLIGNGKLLV